MRTELPNVSDPDIRKMVLRNHCPDETWTVGGLLLSVHCDTCFHDWPCESVAAAREADE